MGFEDAQG
jgi:hypothetical protein